MRTYKYKWSNKGIFYSMMALLVMAGCKKFSDVPVPGNRLSSANVFENTTTLKSAIAGMYTMMATSNSDYSQMGLTVITGMSADEVLYSSSTPTYDPFMYNDIPNTDFSVLNMWSSYYQSIYLANSIIEGVTNSAAGVLPDSMKTTTIAESKFMRAFCHFYLVNVWGEVPLVTTTSYAANNTITRSSRQDVYAKIIADLKEAEAGLKETYALSNGERLRVNKYVAMALLARVSLYAGDYAAAAANADTLIKLTSLYSLLPAANLNGLFVKNNTEAIWQVSPGHTPGYSPEGQQYIPITTAIPAYWVDSTRLLKAFETGDKRYTNWVGKQVIASGTYYYPFKYKLRATNTTATAEYVTFLRLAEQYLIRAEANARLNNLTDAIADINAIRTRAGLGNTTAVTQAEVLLAIEQERRVELCFEYGHRWLDLKRTNRADAVLKTKTGWNATDTLYPVPNSERLNNINLSQNTGY